MAYADWAHVDDEAYDVELEHSPVLNSSLSAPLTHSYHGLKCRRFTLPNYSNPGTKYDFRKYTGTYTKTDPITQIAFMRWSLVENGHVIAACSRYQDREHLYKAFFNDKTGKIALSHREDMISSDSGGVGVHAPLVSSPNTWNAIKLVVSQEGVDNRLTVYAAVGSSACNALDSNNAPTWTKYIDVYHLSTGYWSIIGGYGTFQNHPVYAPLLTGEAGMLFHQHSGMGATYAYVDSWKILKMVA